MSCRVTLEPFGISFECGEDETILAAALRQGVGLRYGCKHGACGSCKARISAGDVDVEEASDFALMAFEREAGVALLCSAYPLEDVVIELEDYEEDELTAARPIREFECTVAAAAPVSGDIWQLRLDVTDAPFEFDAGQFVEVNVPGSDEWRAYSMANSPSRLDEIELLVRYIVGGAFSELMASRLATGDTLRVRGPYGQFRVAEGFSPVIMVAGGSGMAPILSMLRQLSEQGSEREIVFFYGARTRADLIGDKALAEIAAGLASFSYVPALSEPAADDDWEGEVGLVTDVVARRFDNLRASEAYLCGPPGMIDTAIEVLKAKGMFGSRIRFDKFVSTQST